MVTLIRGRRQELVKVRELPRMVLLPEIIKLLYLGGARGKYDVILLFHGAKVGFIKGRIKDGINRNRQQKQKYLYIQIRIHT